MKRFTCKVKFDGNSIALMKAKDDQNLPPLANLPPFLHLSIPLLHSMAFGLNCEYYSLL